MSSGVRPYEHQVAGSHFSSRSQLLRGEFGRVLKPYKLQLNSPLADSAAKGRPHETNKGTNIENGSTAAHDAVCPNERAFYEMVYALHQLKKLRALLPSYYGETSVCLAGTAVPHLCLEDLTVHCRVPCVADLKMGAVREYPGKTPLHPHTDQTKYPSLREVGWCIAGMKHRSPDGAIIANFGPATGRTLATGQVERFLKSFLTASSTSTEVHSELLRRVIEGLNSISGWFKEQKRFWFRSSSILIVYNAEYLQTIQGDELVMSDRQQPGENSPACPRNTELGSLSSRCDGMEQGVSDRTTRPNDVKDASVPLALTVAERKERCAVSSFEKETNTLEAGDGRCDDTGNVEHPPCTEDDHSTQEATTCQNSLGMSNSVDAGSVVPLNHSRKDVTSTPETNSSCDLGSTGTKGDERFTLASTESTSFQTSSGLIVRVKMIDFAHVLDAQGMEDTNYMLGLGNLMTFLSQCQEK